MKASLKFPRISIRGFIEAPMDFGNNILTAAFPRISIRGFIEASFSRIVGAQKSNFREFLFAALLKRGGDRANRGKARAFPRISIRGFIEARGAMIAQSKTYQISANFYSRLY